MNRTDRLLAIVLELQGRGRVRAQDLARQLEVSKRTIYRDVLALNEAGVPIVSIPGQGYSLMEGYFLPPLQFSVEEAVMLILGGDVMAQAFDTQLAGAAESAVRKIGAILTRDVQDEVRFLRDNLKLVQRDPNAEVVHTALLTLRRTIVERLVVEFQYAKRHTGDAEVRHVEPHALFRLNTTWLLAAFDRSRQDMRNFRLDHMDALTVTSEVFERQHDFRLERDEAREGRDLVVRVLFDAGAARWLRQNRSYYVTDEQNTPEGLLVTLRVRTLEEVLPWLLSWGGAAQVLEPVEVRARLREEATAILSRCP